MVKYIVHGGMAEPDNPKKPLHKYHPDIAERVEVEVIGLTGEGSKITTIILSDETDVSDLEEWINAPLSVDPE